MPFPVACLLLTDFWDDVVLLVRWHASLTLKASRRTRRLPGPLPEWPPHTSPTWADSGRHEHHGDFEPSRFDAETLSTMQMMIRRWSSMALASLQPGSREYIAEKATAEDILLTMRSWYSSLLALNRDLACDQANHHRYGSAALLESLRLCAFLKGGAGSLHEVALRCICMGVPEFCSESLLEGLRQQDQSRVPSASLLQRYELSLDIALLLVLRDRRVVSFFCGHHSVRIWVVSTIDHKDQTCAIHVQAKATLVCFYYRFVTILKRIIKVTHVLM